MATLDGLLRRESGNAAWRRERGLALPSWGLALVDKGDARNATQLLEQALANHSISSAKDPTNASWQIDVSRIHFRLADARPWRGDVARCARRLAPRARSARRSREGPTNPLWQRLVAWSDARSPAPSSGQREFEAALTAAVAARDARATLLAGSPDPGRGPNERAQAEVLIARIHARRRARRRGRDRDRSRDRPG
ncbi:MAG: hypothetical protein IPL61_18685 [Myxococcales bacterium]|nr:hypothetical protein [Myxococcales bacterium]